MTSAKDVILTAIKFKGIEHVKAEAKEIADNTFVSVAYVKCICSKVKSGKVVIR